MRVRFTWSFLLAVLVFWLGAVGTGAGQGWQNPRRDRADTSSNQLAPPAGIPLKTTKCDQPNCLAVLLDDFRAADPPLFHWIKGFDLNTTFTATLCTCDRSRRCFSADQTWKDFNPSEKSGQNYSPIRLRDSPLLITGIRDKLPQPWVIRWDIGTQSYFSWNLFISKTRLEGPPDFQVCK